MFRLFFSIAFFAPLLLSTLPARAQDNPAAVIDRAVKAYGGEENLAKFKARQNKTKGTLHIGNGISFTQEVYYQAPGQIKEIMVAEVNGKKSTIVTLLNGDKGSIFVDGQPQEVNDKVLAELKEAAHLARVSRFVGLKDKTYELSVLPEIKLEGKPAVGIKVSAKGLRDIQLYFDKDSGLLVKSDRKALDIKSDQLVMEESHFAVFKDIDGLKTPTQVTVYRDGKKFMEANATDIKHLERLDDNIFAKP